MLLLKLDQVDLSKSEINFAKAILASVSNVTAPSNSTPTSDSQFATIASSTLGPSSRMRTIVGAMMAFARLVTLVSVESEQSAATATAAAAAAATISVDTNSAANRSALQVCVDRLQSSASMRACKHALNVFLHSESGLAKSLVWTRINDEVALTTRNGSTITMSLLRQFCAKLRSRADELRKQNSKPNPKKKKSFCFSFFSFNNFFLKK